MFNTNIDSTSELLSIALAAMRQAIRRYSEHALKMREHGNDEAAAVFERLVAKEQGYAKKITEWASLEGIVINADATPVSWKDPGVETDYDVQARNPHRCTPYKALAFAAHNKERAFLFYTYVAADSHAADVCHHAKVLARAELDHAASLRALRRRAWHAQSRQVSKSRIDPGVIDGIPDLLAIIVVIERYLAHLFKLAGGRFPELDSLAASTRGSLSVSEKALHAGDPPGARVTTALQKVTSWSKQILAETLDATAALRRLCTDCDRSFVFYNSVVKLTRDEPVMLMAQQHSALATRRIAELRRVTDSLIVRG